MVKVSHVLLIVPVDVEMSKRLKKDVQIIYLILALLANLQVIIIY